jgi:hypothetical protein
MSYKLQKPSYYRLQTDMSDRLFRTCWRVYRNYLRDSIDNPQSDSDVLDWLDQIASERVNDSSSTFYLRG